LQTGSELFAAENYHADEIREIIRQLTEKWKQLSSESSLKGELDISFVDAPCKTEKMLLLLMAVCLSV
jgi:type IV secretory pathway ATPase VirB11/archaellum biosynthesis ATPase